MPFANTSHCGNNSTDLDCVIEEFIRAYIHRYALIIVCTYVCLRQCTIITATSVHMPAAALRTQDGCQDTLNAHCNSINSQLGNNANARIVENRRQEKTFMKKSATARECPCIGVRNVISLLCTPMLCFMCTFSPPFAASDALIAISIIANILVVVACQYLAAALDVFLLSHFKLMLPTSRVDFSRNAKARPADWFAGRLVGWLPLSC